MNLMRSLKLSLYLCLTLVCMAAISACSASDSTKALVPRGTAESTGAPAAAVELDNMGQKLHFSEAPKRAVTLNQHATEVMLALGLEKNMAGTAYLDDQILPELQEAYKRVPVLAKTYPSKEVFAEAAPDFAYAGWKSAFTEKSLGTREELAKQGVQTYVQESSNKAAPTLEDVYRDILNIGRIFRVEAKANELVDGMKQRLKDIQDQIGTVGTPQKVFIYDNGEDKAFTAANTYITSLINMIGGKNIFDDIQKSWVEVSWEEVVSRSPDVIVIMDYGDTPVEKKKELLLGKRELADIPAIKNKRLLVLPLSAASEGIRAPIALQTLAEGLYPDKVQKK
ncbi:iron complex transport system substrate-binding protein [Paenibacillus sp. RC84]